MRLPPLTAGFEGGADSAVRSCTAGHQDTGIVCAPYPGRPGTQEKLPAVTTTGLELGRNVSVRIALDDADRPELAGLKLLPTSHRENALANMSETPRAREIVAELEGRAVLPPHRRGGALFYSPYLFHSSDRHADADNVDHGRRRRILTAFYGPLDLRLPVDPEASWSGAMSTVSLGVGRADDGRRLGWLETFPFPQPAPLTALDSLVSPRIPRL